VAPVSGDARHRGVVRTWRSKQRQGKEEAKGLFILMKPCSEGIRMQGGARGHGGSGGHRSNLAGAVMVQRQHSARTAWSPWHWACEVTLAGWALASLGGGPVLWQWAGPSKRLKIFFPIFQLLQENTKGAHPVIQNFQTLPGCR
jgi:hypothetical protein